MKNKLLFGLFVFIFALCGTLGFINVQVLSSSVYASSSFADSWNGFYATEVDNDDFYSDSVLKTVYIRSAKGFSYFANQINNNYTYQNYNVYLETDIDLNSKPWTPIGNRNCHFEGNFYGQGHCIYNLEITSSSDNDNVGLFAFIGGSVSNLHLSNVKINVNAAKTESVGSLAGTLNGDPTNKIENCSVKGKIEVKNNASGALVGGLIGNAASIKDLKNILCDVDITFTNSNPASMYFSCIGGVIGNLGNIPNSLNPKISNVSNFGNITTKNSNGCVGGLVGYNVNSVTEIVNCYNSGNLIGQNNDKYLGGLVGSNDSDSELTISSCYNKGEIRNTRESSDNNESFYVGGLVANSDGTFFISNCFNVGEVSGNYLNGEQVTANAKVDNLYFGSANANNVWYNSSDKMPSDSKAIYNLVNFAKTSGFYSNTKYWTENAWDFDNVWKIQNGINDSYPYLMANSFVNSDNDLSNEVALKGEGTISSPYLIETVADLQYINTILAESSNVYYYSLQNDLDLSGNRTWIPIGYSAQFTGVFDGNNHTISGLNSSLNAQFSAVGLFGYTQNAVIKNLTISDFNYLGSNNTTELVGNLIGRVDEKTYIINCKDESNTGKNTVGKVLNNSLQVFYGKNNLNINNEIDENSLKFNGITVPNGYDLTIYGNGGIFYNSDSSIYNGDYHVLVDTNKQVVNVNIDSNYGKGGSVSSFLPVKSNNITSGYDYVMYPGYTLSGYKYFDKNQDQLVNFDETTVISGNIISGIYADFVEKTNQVTIDYNSYERANFNALEFQTIYEVENDTYLYNNKQVFETINKKLSDRIQLLDLEFYLDENFDKLVYSITETSQGVFERVLNEENSDYIVNDNMTIYAKWVAKNCKTENSKKTVTLRFNKPEDGVYKNFNLNEAISSVLVFNNNDNTTDKNSAIIAFLESQVKEYTEIDGVLTITFDIYTDRSDLVDNYKQIIIGLQEGYSIPVDTTITYTAPDTTFGELKSDIKDNRDIYLYNVLDDIVIDVTVQVSEIISTLSVDNDLYFALSPEKTVETDGVYLYANGAYQKVENVLGIEEGAYNGLYFGYDFVKKAFLSSKNGENWSDKIDAPVSVFSKVGENYCVYVRYGNGSNVKYYCYEYAHTGSTWTCTLYECDVNKTKINLLARLNNLSGPQVTGSDLPTCEYIKGKDGEIGTTLSRLSSSSFVMITSTEDDKQVISDFTNLGENLDATKYTQVLVSNESGKTKLLSSFKEDRTYNKPLFFKTAYTEAFVSFSFAVYNDRTKTFDKLEELAPIATFVDGGPNYSVLENGIIKLLLTPSSNYTLANANSQLTLYSSTGTLSEVSLQLKVTNTGNSDWEYQFNNNNSNYISATYSNGKVELSYKAGILNSGHYEIIIVCENVDYTINYDVLYTNSTKDIVLDNDEVNSGILVSINGTATPDNVMAQNYKGIKYQDIVNIETQFGENSYGYTFVGWQIGDRVITSLSNAFTFDFALYYSQYGDNENLALNINAIYLRRMVNISLSEVVKIEGSSEKINCSDIGLTLNGQTEYTFSTSETPLNFNFVKQNDGVANAYNFSGFELVYLSGEEYISVGTDVVYETEDSASISKQFDIYSVLNSAMRLFENKDVTTYYIMPVLTQKEIKVYVHSGTGDNTNSYGDQKYGSVTGDYGEMVGYDVNNQFFTKYFLIDDARVVYSATKKEVELNFASGYTGYMFLNGEKSNIQSTVNPALLYTQRVGYFVPNFTGFWSARSENLDRSFVLSDNNLVLSNFFTNTPNESLVSIHVYRNWEAINYYINFSLTEEGGTIASGNTLSSVLATYDMSVDTANVLDKTKVLKTGYEFDGWYYKNFDGTSVKIFDADANLVDNEVLFNENGEYKVTSDVNLYAHFETLKYNVRIFVNGATEIEGRDITVESDYLEYYYLFEDVIYDTRFVNSSGIKMFDLIKNLKIKRKGFNFAGLYATSGGQTQLINESTIFDINILSINLNTSFALDLYVMWQYDETSLKFDFIDDNFESRNYNPSSNNQTIYIAEILKDNLTTVGFDVEVDETGTQFKLKPVGVDSASLTLSLVSTSAETSVEQLGDNFMAYFIVNSAGNYTVTLNVCVNDNSNYLSLGKVFNQDCILHLTVNKSGIDFNLTTAQDKQIRLTNVKAIVEPFVSSEVMANVNSKYDFEEIMKALGENYLVRAEEINTKEEVQDILYRYLMYKYYNLTITNDGPLYLQFNSDYEYYDFEEAYFDIDEYHQYINKQSIDNIVDSLYFFESNDYALNRNIMLVDKYDGNLALNTSELIIEKIMFYSANTNGLVPKSSAIMRIYVTEVVSGSLANYNYNTDENGNYINYNTYVYVMPKVLKITNFGAKSSYFEQNIARKLINWKTNSSITYNDETYYLADSEVANLYVKANLYTSNAGVSDSDTEYSFVGKGNFLYFSNVTILLKNNDNFVDVSNYYKLALNEDDIYTILSVAGVAKVTLSATYLTLENGEPIRGNLDDLENYNLLSLLSISSISYTYKYDETNVITGTINGADLVIGDNSIQVSSSEDPSVLVPVTICVVEQNNDNTISVYLNRWVTKAEFSLNQTQIDNYALYQWCLNENRTFAVDGTMESRNSITVVPTFDGQINNVEVSSSSKVFEVDVNTASGLNTTDICAVFTDLVYVAYDYSLPEQLISNLSLASGTNLKLNSSTLADLRNSYPENITGVGGLVLGDVTISWDGVNFYNPSEVFAGNENDSIFVGKSGNAHTALTVKSVWTISELTATQNINVLQVAVQSLNSLLASDVVTVSANENLYDYIYKWEREVDGVWSEIEVEKPDILTFKNGGTSKDSGNYRLTISVKTKDILDGYVENKVLSETYNFEIQFKKHLVSDIVLPNSLTDEYTSSDLLLTNSAKTDVTISYKNWQNENGKYDDNNQTSTQNYLTKGSLDFSIKYFADESSVGESVTEMISAGRYVFTITPNTEIFELSESLSRTFEFEYVVTPCHIEISELSSLAWSKTFNNSDPIMEVSHTYGNDTLVLKFEREAGEETTYVDLSGNKVNLYDVWLASVVNVDLKNYAFYYNDTLIDLSSENKMTVGSFTINAGGTLVVSYEVTEDLPKILTETYSGGVYTLQFDADGNFVIKLNDVPVYTIKPVLYDNLKGSVTGQHLNILNNELQNISAYFASSNTVYTEGISNVSTYSYKFEVGDFSRYYTAVEFDGSYSFVIDKNIIDVSRLNTITKTFDNNNTALVDLDGNVITDIDSYTGAYLIATYSTVHAGNDIAINLEFGYNGDNAETNLANYELSARNTTGAIEKVDATLTINLNTTLDTSSFVYGKVTKSNLSQLVNSESPVTLQVGGVNRTDWLDMLYCTLIYNTDSNISPNGYVYAGTHTLTATNSIFNDFNITNINGAEFTVTAYEFEYTIPANLFIENTTNVVQSVYSTPVSVTGLGENIDLQFEIDDVTFEKNDDGTAKQAGTYHLALIGNGYYSHDSIHVTISNHDTNKGITIVAETNVLYLVVEDISDLSQYYNNKNYNLQLLLEGGKYVLQISSDDTEFVVRKLSTHLQNSAGQVVDIADINGITLALNMSVKEANKYKLALTFTGSNILYTNFISEQFFTVEKVKIDVESANFKQALKKPYDGTYTKTITTFNEKVLDSDVSILVNYNNDPNAGEKDVTLSLQGNDRQNYELVYKDATGKVKGEILKADATILFAHNYSYGDLSTSKDANNFGVEFSVVLSSNREVAITQYTVSSFNVLNPKTSGTYLCVGTYNVDININAINYNINFESSDLNESGNLDIQIKVDKREADLILDRNGGVSAEYMSNETLTAQFEYSDISDLREEFTLTLEREVNESGSLIDVGYYRVKTGSYTDKSGNYLFNVVDNSENGFYQITISTETQYLLLAENGEEVNTENVITTISTQYLGVQFDTVKVKSSEELGLYLEISNSSDDTAEKIIKQLAFYTYDTTNNLYKKNDINIINLNVELSFYSSFVRNVGNYGIYSLANTSDNYNIHVGKSGETICYTLAVTERILTFKDTTLKKSFDNRPASMTYQGYEQLSTVINGALTNEDLGLLVEFYDGANLALHTKSGLTVKAGLTKPTGSSISLTNYKLEGLNSDGIVSGVTGSIIRAGLTVVIDSQELIYGQIMQTGGTNTNINSLELNYTCQPDFEYEQELKLNFVITLPNGVDDFSSARLLKAGNYNMTISGQFDDFEISTVVLNGTPVAYTPTLIIPLRVERKTLTVRSLTAQSLSEILTKAYDGTTAINVSGLIGLNDIEIDDSVSLAGAEFESSHIGSTVYVNFTLDETGDFANYKVAQAVGTINPIIVNITYNDNTPSGVTVTSPAQRISEIRFPLSGTNLTTNSNNAATSGLASFPSTLGGWEGHYLLGWVMNFENIETTSLEYDFLNDYGTYNETSKTMAVSIDNDAKTVNFLNALLNDTNGLFGNAYYYKGKTSVSVNFDAVWDVLKYNVSVKVTDRDGSLNTDLGSFDVVIVDENGQTTTSKLVNETLSIAHGASVTITAHANNHCIFNNIYNRTDNVTSNFVDTYTLNDVKKNYDIWVSFSVDEVNVVLDMSEYSDDITISGGRGLNFDKNGNVFTATVDYLSFEKLKFSNLPAVSTALYNLAGWTDLNTVVLSDDFDTTTLISLLPSGNTLTLYAKFVVAVTLNYNDGVTASKTVNIDYGDKYFNNSDIATEPTREGYDFAGWYVSESLIDENTSVNDAKAHSLTAHWTLKEYNITLTAQNATIDSENLTKQDNIYTAKLQYSTNLTFTVYANSGYEISESGWSKEFSVVTYSKSQATVVLVVPAKDVEFTIPVVPISNHVTLSWNGYVDNIVITNVTDSVNLELDSNNMFNVVTGKIVKIVVTPEIGYTLTDEITFSKDVQYTTDINKGVLTLTISNIDKDMNIDFVVTEGVNTVTFALGDDIEAYNTINILGRNYTADDITSGKIEVSALTNSTLNVSVKFNHGFMMNSCVSVRYDINNINQEIQDGNYILTFDVSSIAGDSDVIITTKRLTYNVDLQVVVFDSDGNLTNATTNDAEIEGYGKSATGIEIGKTVTLKLINRESDYGFVGFSDSITNGDYNILSSAETYNYTVQDNVTVYAVFSTRTFYLSFGVAEHYHLEHTLNGEPGFDVIKEFDNIPTGTIVDLNNNNLTTAEIKFGMSVTVMFNAFEGYRYHSIGTMENDIFTPIEARERNVNGKVEITISSKDIGNLVSAGSDIVNVVFLVTSYEVSIDVGSYIYIDGEIENDGYVPSAGEIFLQDKQGNLANEFGYVAGTRIHYLSNVHNDSHFSVIAYTGDEVYLKVAVARKGYTFYDLITNNQNVSAKFVSKQDEDFVYKVSGLVGGFGKNVTIMALFKPQTNTINIAFNDESGKVNGGAIVVDVDNFNSNKVYHTGNYYSSTTVSAYTDSKFMISAYVRLGYHIDVNNLVLGGTDIVLSNIRYTSLSVENTGYTGVVTFEASNYFGNNDLQIQVIPTTYTVNLIGEDKTLVKIKKVAYNSIINLNENNSDIEIIDNSVGFENGKLNLVMQKTNYNFEGYFTYSGGSGVQYIDSDGIVSRVWQETGYIFNGLTSKYELSNNATVTDEDIQINLYLYFSYFKTKFSFEFVPDISTSYTAENIISGVDYSNSWFYGSSPLYMEVAFDTEITITAPNLNGYKFYKYEIIEKNKNGDYQEFDGNKYERVINWSTNEGESIVECTVRIYYFAQVQVEVLGGEGSFEITQTTDDSQAEQLLREGYVDTEREFSIRSVVSEGYDFVRWTNATTGKTYVSNNGILTLSTTEKIMLIMVVRGKNVTLNFDYTADNGVIIDLSTTSGGFARLGQLVGDNYRILAKTAVVKVGDEVILRVLVNKDFSVNWSNDFGYLPTPTATTDYDEIRQYIFYSLIITPEFVGSPVNLSVSFEASMITVYINSDFVGKDKTSNTTDGNEVHLAGRTKFNGTYTDYFRVQYNQNIKIEVEVFEKYKIASVTLRNYKRIYKFEDFANNEIMLSMDYLLDNNIVGLLQIDIEYTRLLWEKENFEMTEFKGGGTEENPYEIWTVEDLSKMMLFVNNGNTNANGTRYANAYYVLMADINLSKEFWTPIGTWEHAFNGTFDYNGYNILGVANAYIYDVISYGGLFGVLGGNANIIENKTSIWFIFLIVGVVVFLVAMVLVILLINYRIKKRRKAIEGK